MITEATRPAGDLREVAQSRTPPDGDAPSRFPASSIRRSVRGLSEHDPSTHDGLAAALEAALAGGPERHHRKTEEQGKLPVRERIARLVDPESFSEEALLANWEKEGLGADGVVTGLALIGGPHGGADGQRPDGEGGLVGRRRRSRRSSASRSARCSSSCRWSTWWTPPARGSPTRCRCSPAAAARAGSSTTRSSSRAGCRRSASCFGPSAAGGAYIPAFCDVVIMREGNASMYLGSPRMARDGDRRGRDASRRWAARRCTPSVSGCGHFLVESDEEAIDVAKRYLSYMPTSWREAPPAAPPAEPAARRAVVRDRPGGRERRPSTSSS